MTTSTEAQQAHRARAEQTAMDSLAERLGLQFPELPSEEITRAIRGQYAEFDNSRVRDFIPVLVERAVRADLSHAPTHRA